LNQSINPIDPIQASNKMSSNAERIAAAIPAEFHMISGSQDRQTSADVFNTNKVSQ